MIDINILYGMQVLRPSFGLTDAYDRVINGDGRINSLLQPALPVCEYCASTHARNECPNCGAPAPGAK